MGINQEIKKYNGSMNTDEIIAKANEFYEKLNGQRQEDEEGLLVKSHILTLADQPEKTILVLMS
jgi:hypothetical protein